MMVMYTTVLDKHWLNSVTDYGDLFLLTLPRLQDNAFSHIPCTNADNVTWFPVPIFFD